jgi:hypothetical protein
MLDPQWQQRQSDTENQLANMGLSRGSPAWTREKARLDQSQQQAYGSAQNQAIMAGGAESTRLQNAEIARGNFANNAGQQDYQNQVTSQQAQNAGNTAQQQAAQGWQGFRTSEKNAATSAEAQKALTGVSGDLEGVRKFMLQTAQLGWLNHELNVENATGMRKVAAASQELSASSARLEETLRQLSESLTAQLKELANRLDTIQGKVSSLK